MAYRKNLKGVFSLDSALYALLLLATGFSVWSASRYSDLRQSFIETVNDLSHPQVGDWLPQLQLPVLQDPNALAAIASPENGGQLLYFFSPDCPFCQASQPHVERMFEALGQQGNMEMYAISIVDEESTRRYLAETGSRIPTVVMSEDRELNLFQVNSVPALITVNREGQVTYAHYGVLTAKDAPPASPDDARSMEDRRTATTNEVIP